MTDVRQVTVKETLQKGAYNVDDDPSGMHLLVLCGKVHQDAEGWLIRFETDEIVDCTTCGGSGEYIAVRDPDGRPWSDKCPDCNGRGWRLIGGDDECV